MQLATRTPVQILDCQTFESEKNGKTKTNYKVKVGWMGGNVEGFVEPEVFAQFQPHIGQLAYLTFDFEENYRGAQLKNPRFIKLADQQPANKAA